MDCHVASVISRNEAIHGLPRCARNNEVDCSVTRMDCHVAPFLTMTKKLSLWGTKRFGAQVVGTMFWSMSSCALPLL